MRSRGSGCFVAFAVAFAEYPPTDSSWVRGPANPVLNATEPWEGIDEGHPCVCENVALFDAAQQEFVMFDRGGLGT